MGDLLENPPFNLQGHLFVDRSGDFPAITFFSEAEFRQEKGEKVLDVQTYLK